MFTTILLGGCADSVDALEIRESYLEERGLNGRIESLGVEEKVQDAKDKASQTADEAKEKVDEAIDGAKEKAGETASTIKEKASDVATNVGNKAQEVADGAKEQASKESDYLYNGISTEWNGILDTLTSPWGLNKAVDELLSDEEDSDEPIDSSSSFDSSMIGPYSGQTCVTVNGNTPFFTETTTKAFESYSPLDSLGRCGVAFANICPEIMPTDDRGDIGMIKPTGWKQNKYEGIIDEDPPYLYNRCHLIAYSLAGENANPKNLITGTRYFNVETGMEQYELQVLSYVKQTGNHVMYRVTPVFEGDNLLATGVLMEAKSVEDDGLIFCVFVYNIQPGVNIDYKTGENHAA